MLVAYAALTVAAVILVQPVATLWTQRSKHRSFVPIALRSFAVAAVLHGYCMLRLMKTRPYFLNEADFGHWYYKALDLLPEAVKPGALFALFTLFPLAFIALALAWHIHRRGRTAGSPPPCSPWSSPPPSASNNRWPSHAAPITPPTRRPTSSSSAPIPSAATASAAPATGRHAPMASPPPASPLRSTPSPQNPPASSVVTPPSPPPLNQACS